MPGFAPRRVVRVKDILSHGLVQCLYRAVDDSLGFRRLCAYRSYCARDEGFDRGLGRPDTRSALKAGPPLLQGRFSVGQDLAPPEKDFVTASGSGLGSGSCVQPLVVSQVYTERSRREP